MANLPDAWVEDARNLDNAEQLVHSAHGQAASLRPSTPIRGGRGYSDHVSEADPANGAASMRSSFLTPRWRGQSRANPSPNPNSLLGGKIQGTY
jgi:hypothetical protein